jgi:hypothetical protein
MKFISLQIALVLAATSSIPADTAGHEIIDTHFHAMSNKPDGLDESVKLLDENGVSRAIDHPIDASRPKNEQERENMRNKFKKHATRFDRFCIIKPDEVSSVEEAVQLLNEEKQQGAIGFGEHYGRGLMFDAPKNMRLYEACAKVALPGDVSYGCHSEHGRCQIQPS